MSVILRPTHDGHNDRSAGDLILSSRLEKAVYVSYLPITLLLVAFPAADQGVVCPLILQKIMGMAKINHGYGRDYELEVVMARMWITFALSLSLGLFGCRPINDGGGDDAGGGGQDAGWDDAGGDDAGEADANGVTENPVVLEVTNVGTQPRTISSLPDSSKVYVANTGSSSISVIETVHHTVETTIAVDPDPFAAEITPDGAYLFVAHGMQAGSNHVTIIDTDTDAVVQVLENMLDGGRGVAFSPDGQYAYVLSHWDNRLLVISVDDALNSPADAVVDTLTTGVHPIFIAVSADGSLIYVSNAEGDSVTVFDLDEKSSRTIPLGGAFPMGLALSADGTTLYSADKNGAVLVIDTATEEVVQSIAMGGATTGVALSPLGGWIYAAVNGLNHVTVIDPDSLDVETTLSVGAGPFAVAFTANGAFGYVSNMNAGTVSVIQMFQ